MPDRSPASAFVALLLLGLVAVPAAAQQVDLTAYPRLDPEQLGEAYRGWIEEEVAWIITDVERDVFLRLESDARRDEFIRTFWDVRDPSPGTARNEYRELHARRLAQVDQEFGRGSLLPARQTDRGRMWILLGKPQSVNRLPNTTTAVPVEVWFYNIDPAYGTPPFFYLIFFKDRGAGDYRLYSPAIDGPERLLNASARTGLGRRSGGAVGAGSASFAATDRERAIEALRQVDPELGNAAASLVPGESAGGAVSPLRSEMVLARVLDVPNRLMPRPVWAYRLLAGEAESAVRFETLPMEAVAAVLFDPSGIPFVHYATRTEGDSLNLNQYQDEYYLTFDAASTLRDDELRVLDERPSRTLQADLDEATARRLRGGAVAYAERIPIVTERAVLDVLLENNVSRRFARASFRLEVPDIDGPDFTASEPILTLESTTLDSGYDAFQEQLPFQVGNRVLIPAVGGELPSSAAAGVFWQVYLPRPRDDAFEVVYSLRSQAGTLLVDQRIRVESGARSERGLVDIFTELSLAGFVAGDYTLEVVFEEAGLARRLPVRVVPPDDFVRPFLHALRQPPALGVESAVERARQLRTIGDTEAAIGLLEAALERDSKHEPAMALQRELLSDAGRFGELVELINPRLVERPNDAELLLTMASAQATLGSHYDAIRYYERALLAGAHETAELLNALASEHYAEGALERARELLRRSLQLDPEQPQIRRLLDELLGDERPAAREDGYHGLLARAASAGRRCRPCQRWRRQERFARATPGIGRKD